MANEFYNHGAYPANAASGASAPMRSELDNITTGFAKLPTLTGNGNKAVVINSGGTGITVTTGALSLAGNLTMSGAFNTTFVAGATVELTLPTSAGTLALTSSAISNLSGGTAGDAIYQSAVGTTSYLAAGTAGQVYLSGGTGAPTWTTGQLSLAGNVSFTAANNVVFATSGAFTYTLPGSSGTLALSGAGGGPADDLALGAAGDFIYQFASGDTRFIGGSAGEVLLSGGSSAPTFTTGTLALAGNFSTTGAYNLVLAQGASITLTLPGSSQTIATLAGSETLSSKTLTTPTISGTGFANANHAHSGSTSGGTISTADLSGHNAAAHDALVSGVVVGSTASVTLTNKTLTAPIIGATEWTSANHAHAASNSGGTIAISATTGTLTVARGGTGATSLTGVLIGNGASAFTIVAAPSGTIVGTTDTQSLTNKTMTGAVTSGDPTAALGLVPLRALAGMLFGYTLSNNGTDATNDIDAAAGTCVSDDEAAVIRLGTAITKRLDASWSIGTNAGGLDTGSIANTTYHVFAILRSDTGVVDMLFSISATAPTMPTNYDFKRRIGSIVRASSTIVAFTQDGDLFQRSSAKTDASASNPGVSAVTRTLSVPTGIKVIAQMFFSLQTTTTGTAHYGLVTDLGLNDLTPSSSHSNVTRAQNASGATARSITKIEVQTNTSAQVRSRVSASDGNLTLTIVTHGWIDRRGRDS